MNAILLDTYRLISTLKLRGFTEDQAKGITEAVQEIDLSNLASKGDLRDLELRMTLRLGGLIVAGVGFLTAIKFFA